MPDEVSQKSGKVEEEEERASVLLGIVLGANRKGINRIYDELKEEDILLASSVLSSNSSDPKPSSPK